MLAMTLHGRIERQNAYNKQEDPNEAQREAQAGQRPGRRRRRRRRRGRGSGERERERDRERES